MEKIISKIHFVNIASSEMILFNITLIIFPLSDEQKKKTEDKFIIPSLKIFEKYNHLVNENAALH